MSGRGGNRPSVAQSALFASEATGWTATFRRAGWTNPEPMPRQRDPRVFAALLGLLGLSAAVALAAPSLAGASALPTSADGPTCPTRPASSGLPSEGWPTAAGPNGSPFASPIGYIEANDGNLILDRGGALFGGGRGGRDDEDEATEQPTPSVMPSLRTYPILLASPRPMASGVDCPHPKPSPSPSGGDEAASRLPRIGAEPGQPVVAATTSKLTGSKVTMSGLRFEGIVDLPTADGSLTALKVSMDEAVTDDFLLRTPGPAGRTMRFATDRLTVSGDVAFYTTRFVGRLTGTKIALAPDLPFPDVIPMTSPIAITLTDPAIDLAFVNSDVLTARPRLKLTLD
jgi:hypothetical protein